MCVSYGVLFYVENAGQSSQSASARYLRLHRQGVLLGEDPSAGCSGPHGALQEDPATLDAADRGTTRTQHYITLNHLNGL